MAETQTVQIAEAKGRPMLHWVGKRPLDHVTAYPAQEVETFNPTGEQTEAQGLLFHGDNKDVLAWLLAHGYRGKVNLIYIDPPFDSGADYVRRVQLRGVRTQNLEGESHSLGEQIQYTDIWANDMYLQFMYERLLLLKELLAETGCLFVHLDPTQSHYLKVILDEIFGQANFRNEIIWRNNNAHSGAIKQFGPIHQDILFYTKSNDFVFHPGRRPFTRGYIEDRFVYEDERGSYQTNYLTGPGLRFGESGEEWRGFNPSSSGRHWAIPSSIKALLDVDHTGMGTLELLELLFKKGFIVFPQKEGGQPMYKQYMTKGVLYQDLWAYQPNTRGVLHGTNECIDEDVKWIERLPEAWNYPTIKPEGLVARIIRSSSKPGDLVLDCFVGSGTTAAVAQKLGRRWIAADVNKGAVQTTSKRLQTVIQEQIEAGAQPRQAALDLGEGEDETPPPAALSFRVYRVNDYDLQVQHNEAVNLAVELVGIERLKTDPFFEGTRGAKLVKIVPFNHPLTPLDLQLLQDELKARPDEERDVVVVCLGKELAVDAWLEDYNRHRPINKIEVIELRTDQKYGKFFLHQPAQAQVNVARADGQIVVEIEDFISPTIVERLEMDTPLFKAHIPDWRAMVDVVLIDTAYDGEVFNIALSDVPERKADLVVGRYELPAPEGETTVAVKIVDMLGEEVLVTEEV
jgi:adenine-specific DNA-methyltransferase